MDFLKQSQEGLRFSWNTFPNSSEKSKEFVVPVGCLYTPNKINPEIPILPLIPFKCKVCNMVLNPYCAIDESSNNWTCGFCYQRNKFPERKIRQEQEQEQVQEQDQEQKQKQKQKQEKEKEEKEQEQEQEKEKENGEEDLFLVKEILLEKEEGYKMKEKTRKIYQDQNKTQKAIFQANKINKTIEMLSSSTTIEYILTNNDSQMSDPCFLFLIDLCCSKKELDSVKAAIIKGTEQLPLNSQIALVTCGANIAVYDFSNKYNTKTYQLYGSRTLDFDQIQELLFLNPRFEEDSESSDTESENDSENETERFVGGANKYFRALSEIKTTIPEIFQDLQPEYWPVEHDLRSKNSFGNATKVAITLMASKFRLFNLMDLAEKIPKGILSGRVISFLSGPPTVGGGIIVDRKKSNFFLSHNDLEKKSSKLDVKPFNYYNNLANIISMIGITFDLFACSYDQVGCYQMQPLVSKSGGHLLIGEQFASDEFSKSFDSFLKNFTKYENLKFNSIVEVNTTPELQIMGTISNCYALDRSKNAKIDEKEIIGTGKTNRWKINYLDPQTTLAIYFSIANKKNNPLPNNKLGLIQFKTMSIDLNGNQRIRITTSAHNYSSFQTDQKKCIFGFDQEAATVLISRMAVWKRETEKNGHVVRWIDRSTINLCKNVAQYKKKDIHSFNLPSTFLKFPLYMYHLRRSPFLDKFGKSPDQSTFLKLNLLRQNISNSMKMIIPLFQSYSLNNISPTVEKLEMNSIKSDNILLLDTFFHILIHNGSDIITRNNNHNNNNNNNNDVIKDSQIVNNFIEKPIHDAKLFSNNRFPYPKIIQCKEGSSQSRILLSKLSPNENTNLQYGSEQKSTLTDLCTFEFFFDYLKRVVVGKK
ncbi:protein transport protein sec23 [Anaeramoeba flamelloides]|uniref:Protein transport protein SEC23 n=1 Tax=Anaeramoeba flamelloides TaxID=1746091 RepID=A0AAV8ACR9_9EUKA|nr:protein transport protein sec23 [Anaeramoeba flamelloides]